VRYEKPALTYDQQLDRLEQWQGLQRQINTLQKKVAKERKYNRKIGLNAELRGLKQQREELV
jgi:hypothetical protein